MIRILYVLAALAFAAPALASDKSDIATAVNAYNDTLNRNDLPGAAAFYAPAPSIIDEFAPHLWSGAQAFSQWGADYGVYAAANKMTDPFMVIAKPAHVVVSGDRGYAVFPANFKFKRAGKPAHELGILTFAMVKFGGAWKIAGWAWSIK
ncbi:MAG TPA: nuclear transport factor 2 family protein [Rhizomicrobium sp.]